MGRGRSVWVVRRSVWVVRGAVWVSVGRCGWLLVLVGPDESWYAVIGWCGLVKVVVGCS